jgi:LysR family glycine cleavage system transcriptional activator
MRLPPLRALQAFRHAGTYLSFKLAAEHLYVSPTAISQQIKQLEDALGVKLFKRKTREVELTAQGQQFLHYVSRAFQSLEEGVAKFGDDPNPSRLILSSLPSFSARFLIPRLASYQRDSGGIAVHLQTSLALSRFEGEEIDAAVRLGKGRYPGLASRHLMDDFIIAVCHPSLMSDKSPVEQQLSRIPVLLDSSEDMGALWQRFQEASGVVCGHDASTLHVSDASMLIEAVLAGQGISLMRYSLVYELLEKKLLCCPLPYYIESEYALYLVAPEWHFKRVKISSFESWLRSELTTIEESWSAFCTERFSIIPLPSSAE